MNYNRVVCFDLEMCCWNQNGIGTTGEIIEIGLAEIDVVQKRIVKRAQYYVMPERDEVSEFCTELTGISQRKLDKQARPLAEVLRSVVKNFGGRNKLYACWGRDELILQQECLEKSLDCPIEECLNMVSIFALKQRMKDCRFGQRQAMELLDISWEGRQHSAYVDAYNLAKLALNVL